MINKYSILITYYVTAVIVILIGLGLVFTDDYMAVGLVLTNCSILLILLGEVLEKYLGYNSDES